MGLVSDSACVDVLVTIATVFIGIYIYFKWSFKYWERKNVPFVQPTFPFGTINSPFSKLKSFAELNKKRYQHCKSKGLKHVGIYILNTPVYMPINTEYIKNIMSKDFDHFVDRGVYYNEKDDPLSAHLFSLEGTRWRNLRMKLTPTFTSGKMKMMFQTLVVCGNQLKNAMDDICSGKEAIDIRDVLGRYTTDVIGSCAFGLDCNSFQEPNSDLRRYSKRAFTPTKLDILKTTTAFSSPNIARYLRVCITPTEVSNFFMNIIKQTVEYREKNNFTRKDFLQLLIDLKIGTSDETKDTQTDGKRLTIEELAAQAFVFFLAGFETSSTTMTFCLYELASNEDIQEKVRNEVNAVLEKYETLTYDAAMEMKYLGQVIDETLRKYPPIPLLNRRCVKDYKIPGTDLTIEKGIKVSISVIGLHHDAEHFPDPEKFDPERFNEKNKSKVNPYAYMPFGEGPRVCIGLRFGIMQSKVGLAILLKHYKFKVHTKTRTPIEYNPRSFILAALGGIWLEASKIEE